ncbi:MAG: lysophospholipid acyltransferase family protein [Calditrichia bacterium]
MPGFILALYRTAGFCVVTAIHVPILWLGYPFAAVFGKSDAWRVRMVRRWAKSICRMIGMNIQVIGQAPKPPFFLVSNHLSYIDIILYFSLTDCIFVAKSEVSNWPVMGSLAKIAGTLFINRKQHRDIPRVNRLMQELLNEQQGILLFPEGTSSAGENVLPFKPSLLQFPAEQGLHIHCAAVKYVAPSGYDVATDICWWGDMTFVDHLWKLFQIPCFSAKVAFSQQTASAEDRKAIAVEAEVVTKDLFRKLDTKEFLCQ